jgi:sugar lactone lactonase YvrE
MATIPVPLTFVQPWLWYEAADPTMVRNTGTTLTAWYNKGSSGSLTNGTITGTISYGSLSQNGFSLTSIDSGSVFRTPSISAASSSAYSLFTVVKATTNGVARIVDGPNHLAVGFNNATQLYFGISGQGSTVSLLTIPDGRTEMKLYSFVASGTGANSSVSINGSVVPINTGNLTNINGTTITSYPNMSGGNSTASVRLLNDIIVGETIVCMGEITTTNRQQIEGYLAWKWGLQANLPTTHPYSVANKAATMALYGRPHGFTSVFLSGLTGVRGVICDSTSNLYVARGSGNDVRKYNAAGTLQWTVSTVGGVACNNPAYIARDASDNIYVAETTGQRIIKITAAGSASVFKSSIPVGPITVDSIGAVYYHDTTALNIKKITADGATTTTFNASQASTGLVCDASNNIYASHNFAITKISSAGSGTTFVGTAGSSGSTDAIGADARFNNDTSSSLGIDSRGYIYVAENSGKKVRMISPAGAVLTITGQAATMTPAAATDNGIDINARYNSATGVAAAPDGSVYIADMTAGNVRKIGFGVMNQVGTIAGPASGSATTGNATGNALGSLFNNPSGVIYLPDGTMYFADSSNTRICKMTPTGIISNFRTARSVQSLALDSHNNIYSIYAGQAIYKNTPAGLETTFVAGTSPLNNAYSIAFDASNNGYIANTNGNTIIKITPTGTTSTLAGSGTASSADGTGTGATFNSPAHIAYAPSGTFYVVELSGRKVRKVTTGGVVTTIASSTTFGGDLIGVAVDISENVYVAQRSATANASLVRMITPAQVVSTIAGGGSGTATDAVGTSATFGANHYFICTDQHNNVFVSDQTNAKIRMVARNALPSGSVSITGTLTQGQALSVDTSALVDINGLGSFTYAWYSSSTADGVYTAISGATSPTLTLTETQVAKYIKVTVSYTDGRGSAESVSSSAVGAIVNVNDTAVGLDISGTLASGSTLTAITATIVDPDGNAPPYTYQWSSSTFPTSDFSNIEGATESTYVLTSGDVNKYIRLTVSYTNNYGQADSAVATTGSTVIILNSPVQGTLGISGDIIEGRTLRANTTNMSDPDGFGAFTYTWSSSTSSDGLYTVDASGLDVSGITLVSGQVGRYIKLEIRYTDGLGNSEYIISSVVGPVVATTVPGSPSASAEAAILSANLTWSAPAFDGYLSILGYRVFDASGSQLVDTSGTSYTATGLISGRLTAFTIVAYNTKGEGAVASISVIPLAPTIASIETGEIPENIQIPASIAGIPAIIEKVTPVVEADGTKSVFFAPEPEKAAVAIANLPAEIEKVVVATAAPQNGYTTLKISAFDSVGSSVSDFAATPLTITITIPGYTAESLLVRTFQEIGGPVTDTLIATRNQDGTYTMTLTHLTYIRVSENVPCFVAGTKILTAAGYKAVEEIVDGELIATADGRALPCRIYITEIDATIKENAPYVIPANTFAPRCPARDLALSPLHAIQLTRGVWQIPKMAATLYSGVRQMPIGKSITYYHLEMPNYLTDNIVAEGTVVESYGARQLAGRRVEYKFSGAAGGFIRTITEARTRGVAVKRA